MSSIRTTTLRNDAAPGHARGVARQTVPALRPSLGNQAVQSLLLSRAVQAKLTVSQPGDSYEREADRVADEVMRMPEPGLQRKCASCESGGGTCAECAEEEETVQRKEETSGTTPATDASPIPHGGGQPLSTPERGFFESRFGRDFGGVRVHTGAEADASARSIHALAYTHGSDIVFRSGQYSPQTMAGQRLLAHELTHVVQQDGRRDGPAPRIMPYRPSSAANFSTCNGSTLKEDSFGKGDEKTKPWIETIDIHFDSTTTDSAGDLIPTWTLTVTYFSNPAQLSSFSVSVVGGKASEGLTDKGNHKVKRIEGCGYHHTTVPKADRITGHPRAGKYFKPSLSSSATMNFAVFFVQGKSSGNQAIHEGSLSSGSLACVHVGTRPRIRRINYHSVVDRTKVNVSYDATALKDLCCERHKAAGRMVSNPCKGQDPKKCP